MIRPASRKRLLEGNNLENAIKNTEKEVEACQMVSNGFRILQNLPTSNPLYYGTMAYSYRKHESDAAERLRELYALKAEKESI